MIGLKVIGADFFYRKNGLPSFDIIFSDNIKRLYVDKETENSYNVQLETKTEEHYFLGNFDTEDKASDYLETVSNDILTKENTIINTLDVSCSKIIVQEINIIPFEEFESSVTGYTKEFIQDLRAIRNVEDIIVYEDGAVRVNTPNTLSPSFILDDKTYWGYYSIFKTKRGNDEVTVIYITGGDDTAFEKEFESYEQAKEYLSGILYPIDATTLIDFMMV